MSEHYTTIDERLKTSGRIAADEIESMIKNRLNLFLMWIAKARQAKQNISVIEAEIIKLAWTQGNPDEETMRVVFDDKVFEITSKVVGFHELVQFREVNIET